MPNWFDTAKKWLVQITEMFLLLVALAIVLQVLVGGALPFFGDVVGDLVVLIKSLGDSGVVGLIAVAIILWLFSKRAAA